MSEPCHLRRGEGYEGSDDVGRHKKYASAAALEKAVDRYFASLSYQEPVMVQTPTGAVDEYGRPETALRMLTDGPDGTGRPVTVTRYITAPSMAGLYLALRISKETWSSYGTDCGEEYAGVVERARLRMEAYWADQLTGKSAQGAKFALSCCYGWREKAEVSGDGTLRVALGAGMEEMTE